MGKRETPITGGEVREAIMNTDNIYHCGSAEEILASILNKYSHDFQQRNIIIQISFLKHH